MSSTSELSDSLNTPLPNLDKELKALTTTTLQSPSKPYHYQTQHETKYPSITIPSGIAKLILIDLKNQDRINHHYLHTIHQAILYLFQLNLHYLLLLNLPLIYVK